MQSTKAKPEPVSTYETKDLILGSLNHNDDPKGVSIQIALTPTDVILTIGPRDWQWDRKTGEMIGCGTMLM